MDLFSGHQAVETPLMVAAAIGTIGAEKTQTAVQLTITIRPLRGLEHVFTPMCNRSERGSSRRVRVVD